ncbi:hypothetical protein BDR04DRAFT_1096638 [Suillus decipiens]|nr:hypothetical protein BDR04DRAFT_1096638 [Suillus decipiens]
MCFSVPSITRTSDTVLQSKHHRLVFNKPSQVFNTLIKHPSLNIKNKKGNYSSRAGDND